MVNGAREVVDRVREVPLLAPGQRRNDRDNRGDVRQERLDHRGLYRVSAAFATSTW